MLNIKIQQNIEQKTKRKKEYEKKKSERHKKKKKMLNGTYPVRINVTPPKFTGGVTWKYLPSKMYPNLLGTNFEFKFGALPLTKVTGRLDILFAAQFIPYLGQVVRALDKAVSMVNKVGDALDFLKLGSIEAEYYFDLVCDSQLDIDIVKGATYHTIDGFTSGNIEIISPINIGLEAGGSIKAQFLDIKGETSISAEAVSKFKIYYFSNKKDFFTFEFEGVEAVIKCKQSFSTKTKDYTDDNPQNTSPKSVPILKGFKIEVPLS